MKNKLIENRVGYSILGLSYLIYNNKIMKSIFLAIGILVSIGLRSQDLYFPPSFSSEWEEIPSSELNWADQHINEVKDFLDTTQSKAMIILKDGKIAFESYHNGHTDSDYWYWASAGKTVTSVLTGICADRGLLDINDATSDYLGEGWTNCSAENESEITIKNQLTMTTGLDYTLSADCTEPSCLECINGPDQEWFYHNAPYTLITKVIEQATEDNLNMVTRNFLTNKLGFLGLWIDVDYLKVYNSTARGMARFGLMMLAGGKWNGEAIIEDQAYYNAMINTSQDINESYGYLWWLNGKESFRLPGTTITFGGSMFSDVPSDAYAAVGKNGQVCLVVPSENVVIIRMGNQPDDSLVPVNIVNEIWLQYEKLNSTTSISNTLANTIRLIPSFGSETVRISYNNVDEVSIISSGGQVVKTVKNQNEIRVSDLTSGVYFFSIVVDGQRVVKRFVRI